MKSDYQNAMDVSSQGDVLVVSFRQTSIDGITGVEQVAEALRSMIGDCQPRKMVVDFSQVRFFSSQMLGLLVDIWRRMQNFGGLLIISGIDPQLTRVFKITHLDRLFSFYESRELAVASLQAS